MAKSHKILIYVEGESEIVFFRQYLNKYIKDKYEINLECQQGDIPTFKRYIKRGIFSDFKAIFVLRDLKTEIKGHINYSSITKMKNDFTTKKDNKFIGNIGKNYEFIVVCNEIESWLLTHRKSTNNRNEKHIQELFKEFKCTKKPECVKKVIAKLKRGQISMFDITKNKSFEYFIGELIKCK